MILYINVFITQEKIVNQGNVVRENAKYSNNLDIYKYMLASLSNFFPWKRVIINTKLDDYYESRREELNNFINQEFSQYDLIVRNTRNEYQNDWQNDYDLINDNLLLFLCNHDHIFTDPDPSYFASLVDKFKDSDDYIGIQFTAYPELGMFPWCPIPWNSLENMNFELEEDYMSFKYPCIHSAQVITKKVYHHWWFDYQLPNTIFGRPDWFTDHITAYHKYEDLKFIVPFRETTRHFDGYQHCTITFGNQVCPVLEIPDGFFENDIKINYSTNYINGKTNINPITNKLKIYAEDGFELNISKKYIPHFWKNKISEFKDDFSLIIGLRIFATSLTTLVVDSDLIIFI
jgi:hypothetical protein